jgi:hypothetical protein
MAHVSNLDDVEMPESAVGRASAFHDAEDNVMKTFAFGE